MWKGAGACYTALHFRVERARGKPRLCEECGTTTAKRYEWASVSHKYDDVNDYRRLCKTCHVKFDKIHRNFGNVPTLNADAIEEIRRCRSASPPVLLSVLAKRFGVCDATISMAANGRTWISHPAPTSTPLPQGPKTMLESQLQAALLLMAPRVIPSLRLFRRNVLVARIEGRSIRTGIKGQCDLHGYFRGGKAIEIELKGPKGRILPEQRAWATWCAEWGVLHLTLKARADETIDQTVERWCNEIVSAATRRH